MNYFVFDVESVGLFGEGFQVGWVLIDERSTEIACGEWGCNPIHAEGTQEDLTWVGANVKPVCNCKSPRDVRYRFGLDLRTFGDDALICAEVPWPVEARFLLECLPLPRSIYPLIDIASVRYGNGIDPLATCERMENELPIHWALGDARQSARLLLEALR